jgi:hypothetical protein
MEERTKKKCTAIRLVDGKNCQTRATHEVVIEGIHAGYVCGIHKRAWLPKALRPIGKLL